MNDVKATFYKTLNTIVGTNRVDNQEAYIINDYIGRLEATIKDEQQEIKRLKDLYEKTCKHLFNIGNDELARYFQAQINECNVFVPQDLRGENNE